MANADLQTEYTGLLAQLVLDTQALESVGAVAIQTLCQTLEAHPLDEAVQTRVVYLLASLAALPANQLRLKEAGGIPVLLACLQQHMGNANLQRQCCRAMQQLSSGNDEMRQEIVSAGGVQSIADAMQAHPDEQELQQAYCAVLVDVGEDIDVEQLL